MPFKPGPDPNRNLAGRPRGRIAEFREHLGSLTNNGAEIAEGLVSMWRDPSVPSKERLAAYELALAYLLGKPEATLNVEGEVGVGHRVLDLGVMLGALPDDVLDQMLEAVGKGSRALLHEGGKVIDVPEGEMAVLLAGKVIDVPESD